MEEKEMKILIFSLNGEHYATDITDVERILRYIEPTKMPDVPEFVEGVINYGDEILPILNLSKKFKFSSNDEVNYEEKKIIVIKRGNKFGVIVDIVYEVTDISNDIFEKAPKITSAISKNYIKGLVKLNGEIIILLDIDKVLSDQEEELIF
ncbi:chemotaxis protein CheW [uncultured Clostridium sp.]|uniref:chemotaxis protein CheW n=1 Tax=uncultured Clostridium sp. TaxID=59620 RepID=UPI0025F6A66A|nr:chemotaxis protein CheW [uncultured Clostridium sp.]